MKKALLILASAMMLGISANAQEFAPSWNIQIRGGAAETVGETNFGALISPAADLALGYQFTPVFGLRLDLMAWQGKGAMSGLPQTEVYKFRFGQAAIDATFDICNIFNTKVTRAISPYIYAGIGGALGYNNDEAVAISKKEYAHFEYLWEDKLFTPAGRAGVGFDIRLSDAVKLNLEAGANVLNDKFNSKKNYEHNKMKMDFQYTGLVGIKIAFGKKKAPAPVVVPEPAPAPAPAPAPKPEPKVEPKPAPAPAPVELQENIYFVINKWDIQASEVAKIDEIAAFMKENAQTKVSLTGYADKATGTAQRNMFLSQKRAEIVSEELVKRGIDESRISVSYKGDTENPFATPEENRVTVCFAK